MIDDEDVEMAEWGLDGSSAIGLIVGILIICVIYWIARSNNNECAKKHCDRGKPMLMHHECVCEDPAQ